MPPTPNRPRPASPQLWTPQSHSPRFLVPLPVLKVPTSLVLGPTCLQTQTQTHALSLRLAPYSLAPAPALLLALLAPLWPRPPGSGHAPSPFPLGRPKSLGPHSCPLPAGPSPSPGPAPLCSGPALSPRPPRSRPPRPLPLTSSLGSLRGSATECRRDSGSAEAADAAGGSEVTVNLRLMARGAAGSHKWPQLGCGSAKSFPARRAPRRVLVPAVPNLYNLATSLCGPGLSVSPEGRLRSPPTYQSFLTEGSPTSARFS